MAELKRWLAARLREVALERGRLSGLWRKFAPPNGEDWALYLRRWGGLYAMGERCSIQPNVVITDPSYVRLGHNVRLSGCTLFGHDGVVNMLRNAYGGEIDRVGKIDIRDNVFIGHQAIVMPGVTIGPDAVVAANSVVTRDVPPGTVVGGVPAKPIGTTAALHASYVKSSQELPWRDLLAARADPFEPVSPALQALRLAHFFPPESPSNPSAPPTTAHRERQRASAGESW